MVKKCDTKETVWVVTIKEPTDQGKRYSTYYLSDITDIMQDWASDLESEGNDFHIEITKNGVQVECLEPEDRDWYINATFSTKARKEEDAIETIESLLNGVVYPKNTEFTEIAETWSD